MPKRRANGEGNIRKRKDGRWEGRYTAGYDANGKAITKNVLGKTQAEVKDKLRAAIEDSKKLDPVKAGSYTLEQWLKLWYSVYVEPQVRYSTKEFYHNAIDHHIIPKLGNVKLEKLTMLQIQQFYNELLKSGRVQKKNQPELKEHSLSPRMVQCVHVVLNKTLEHAVEEKLILANPAKKCKIPKCAYRLNAAERRIDVKVRNIGQRKCYNDLRKRRRSLAWHEQRASRLKNFAPDSARKMPAGRNYSGFDSRMASSARNAAVRNITWFAGGIRSSAAPADTRPPSPQEPLCTARICR